MRVVLDSNTVLSALLFSSGRLVRLRHAWEQRQIVPLLCKETAAELIRILAYPKFRLSHDEQQDLLSDFLPYAEVAELPSPWPALPLCRDAKDQAFLVLAHAGKADALVTGDNDLLAMRGMFADLIWPAEAFLQSLTSRACPR